MSNLIQGVEIFRTGKWNGDNYSESDLDAMVDAYNEVGFRPPLKLGYDKKPGARAFGWVQNPRRVGDRLIADFVDIPKEIYETIRQRGYDAVSCELYWNLERGGRTFARVLKAVALLGAEIPAVAGLRPLREVVHELHAERTAICTLKMKSEAAMPTRQMTDTSPIVKVHQFGLDIDRRVREIRMESGCTYAQALDRIRNFEPELYRQYAEEACL